MKIETGIARGCHAFATHSSGRHTSGNIPGRSCSQGNSGVRPRHLPTHPTCRMHAFHSSLSLSLNAPPIQPDTARNAAKFYGLKFYYILLHTCSCYYGRILSSTGSECVAPSCNPSLYLHPRAVPNGHSIFHSVDINEQALDVNRFASHVGSS